MNQQRHTSILYLTYLTLLIPLFAFANVTQDKIGEVVFARGAVSAQSLAGEIRVLGKQAPIYQGDVITTGPKSFSVIKMIDDSRISVRPDTVFSFKNYSLKENEESAVMQLFKGGLRAISGLISKRNPEAFKLNTAVATIGIRGTDFDVRLCEVDCAIDEQKYKKKKGKLVDDAVAKIAFLKGDVYTLYPGSAKVKLETGSALIEGDTVETGGKAIAVIVFRDKGRVTLKENTQFKIEEHRYSPDRPQENSAIFKLIKGGMRALTGLIGKKNKEAYKVNTPTATIGIRGTGYDLVWLGPCSGGATSCGLNGSVWLGSIYAKNDAGEFELLENQSFIVRLIDTPAAITDTPPILDIPRPDEVDINFEELFGEDAEDVPSGLYANTREGIVYMERDGEIIEMHPGEGGFISTDGSTIVKLERPRTFQTNDPYLETINEEFETLYELLDESVIEQNDFECTVQ
jgi:hypothetical protein